MTPPGKTWKKTAGFTTSKSVLFSSCNTLSRLCLTFRDFEPRTTILPCYCSNLPFVHWFRARWSRENCCLRERIDPTPISSRNVPHTQTRLTIHLVNKAGFNNGFMILLYLRPLAVSYAATAACRQQTGLPKQSKVLLPSTFVLWCKHSNTYPSWWIRARSNLLETITNNLYLGRERVWSLQSELYLFRWGPMIRFCFTRNVLLLSKSQKHLFLERLIYSVLLWPKGPLKVPLALVRTTTVTSLLQCSDRKTGTFVYLQYYSS